MSVPADLHRRARAAGKPIKSNFTQMVCVALREYVGGLEEKQRQELAQQEATRIARGHKRPGRPKLRSLDLNLNRSVDNPLLPVESQVKTPFAARRNLVDETCAVLAKTIYAAQGDPEELRRRATAAVEAVQRNHPLTAPDEGEILLMLEEHVVKLAEGAPVAAPKERTYDQMVAKVIDVDRLGIKGSKPPALENE